MFYYKLTDNLPLRQNGVIGHPVCKTAPFPPSPDNPHLRSTQIGFCTYVAFLPGYIENINYLDYDVFRGANAAECVLRLNVIIQPRSSVVAHVLVSGNLSVLSNKTGINNCTP
jgi:hypothetical protein